ncbi:hypothetical protein BGZ46_003679 [Entomortierella lignicola]|nr:hypothetical protein BGZ46_003679 [Entomortierella lignicola]
MISSISPLDLPEILSRIITFMDVSDRVSAAQVNWLWNQILTPSLRSISWSVDLPEHERNSILCSLYQGDIHTFECQLTRYSEGKVISYSSNRDTQQKLWEPVKAALIKGTGLEDGSTEIQLQKWVVKGSDYPEEDFFQVLLAMKSLRHFWLESFSFIADVSKLFRILGLPSLQTLRRLTVKNASWSSTGLPFPNKVQCQLRKLVLENTRFTEQNLMRLLESCPLLEEFVGVEVLFVWFPRILQRISMVNPLLNSFVISCLPCSSGKEIGDRQLDYIIKNLTLNMKTLGFHRLSCKPEAFEKLQFRFRDLERLEIHGTFNPVVIHEYLSSSPCLRHLVAREVFLPISLLEDKGKTWTCKNLLTLELSFEQINSESQEGQNQSDSKSVIEYLVSYVPNVQRMWIRKQGLLLDQSNGSRLLKGLNNLEHLTIVAGLILPLFKEQCVDENSALKDLKARLKSLSLQ